MHESYLDEVKYGSVEPFQLRFLIKLFKCVSRIQVADPEYKKAFDDELVAFKDRIRRRAQEKIEEQLEEARREEEEDRLARLGPGGLDPLEVYETLPDVSAF